MASKDIPRPPPYTNTPPSNFQPPNVQVIQQPTQPIEQPFPNWDTLKSPSAILRLTLALLLLACCIMMGRASLLKALIEFNDEIGVLNEYFEYLKLARNLYISFAAILLAIQLLKIIFNLLNIGDQVPNTSSGIKCLNIFIAVAEGLLHTAFFGSAVVLAALAFFLFLDIDFGVAMGLVVPCLIIRSIISCVDCCCKPRPNLYVQQPQVIVYSSKY